MRKLMIALAVAPLVGCASAEQLAKQDGAHCESFGYKSGTEIYGRCLERQAEIRAADAERRAQERAQMRAALAAALANTGQMYQERAAAAAAPPPQTFQTCHTILDPNTNAATTHCY